MPDNHRMRRWVPITSIAVFVALYAILVLAYAVGGASSVSQPAQQVPDGGIGVILVARGITAATPEIELDVQLAIDPTLLDDDGAPLQPIALTLEPTQDDADLLYDTDRRPPVRQIKMPVDGDIEDWPFDGYSASITAIATSGKDNTLEVIPTVVILGGGVQGWQLAAGLEPNDPFGSVDLSFHRSLAIVLFGLSLVAVLILLPVTTWIVGWKLFREDRLFEAGFLGWIGAMLFATIPIRNFFPGSPPPGSWVDVLVTLWVIVALAAVLIVALAAFIKNPRRNH
jgi:hypothetical protein